MPNRKKKYFKRVRFNELKLDALNYCQQRGHRLTLDSRWRGREISVNERFECCGCHLELFIQFNPPAGYQQVHGTALGYDCKFPYEVLCDQP